MYRLVLWGCVCLGYLGGSVGLTAAQGPLMRAPKALQPVAPPTPGQRSPFPTKYSVGCGVAIFSASHFSP